MYIWFATQDSDTLRRFCDDMSCLYGRCEVSFSCALTVHVIGLLVFACNRPSCLATVFERASDFNGDLNQWNVTSVTDMPYSKSVAIV